MKKRALILLLAFFAITALTAFAGCNKKTPEPTAGTIYKTKIFDITHIVDSVGVGDAFVGAYIHASNKWPGQPQRCLDFCVTAAMLKNSIVGDFNLVTEEEILEQMP